MKIVDICDYKKTRNESVTLISKSIWNTVENRNAQFQGKPIHTMVEQVRNQNTRKERKRFVSILKTTW